MKALEFTAAQATKTKTRDNGQGDSENENGRRDGRDESRLAPFCPRQQLPPSAISARTTPISVPLLKHPGSSFQPY